VGQAKIFGEVFCPRGKGPPREKKKADRRGRFVCRWDGVAPSSWTVTDNGLLAALENGRQNAGAGAGSARFAKGDEI